MCCFVNSIRGWSNALSSGNVDTVKSTLPSVLLCPTEQLVCFDFVGVVVSPYAQTFLIAFFDSHLGQRQVVSLVFVAFHWFSANHCVPTQCPTLVSS